MEEKKHNIGITFSGGAAKGYAYKRNCLVVAVFRLAFTY